MVEDCALVMWILNIKNINECLKNADFVEGVD
jgi:hypothetical protein